MESMFQGCSGLTGMNISTLNTENVTTMESMFQGCSGLTSINISNNNMKNVETLTSFLNGCSGLTSLDISNWDTSSAKTMTSMLQGCSGLSSLTIGNINTENVTNMGSIFSGCSGLTSIDVSGLDTENVTTMASMFYGCSKLSNLDISDFNTDKVSTVTSMFSGCSALKSIELGDFNTSAVKSLTSMFQNCNNLTTLDLSSFDTSLVTTMTSMFQDCSKLTTIYVSNKFVTSAVTSTGSKKMFENCLSLIGGAGTEWSSSNITHTYAHIDGGTDNPGYFTDTLNRNIKVTVGGIAQIRLGSNSETYSIQTQPDDNIVGVTLNNNKLIITGRNTGTTTAVIGIDGTSDIITINILVISANYSISTDGDVQTYQTLAEALADASDNQTIKVMQNVSDNSIITVDKNVTLDTDGKTITNSRTITVNADCKLTITGDGTITSGEDINLITNNGTVEIASATISSTVANTSYSAIANSGTVTMSGGTVSGVYKGINNYAVNTATATVEISGGLIKATDTGTTSYGIYNYGTSATYKKTVNVTGGTVGALDGDYYGIYNYGAAATTNVKGGTVAGSDRGIHNQTNAETNIGDLDIPVSNETPVIIGRTTGMYKNGTTGKWNYYNGILKGKTNSYSGTVTKVRDYYYIEAGTEEIDGETYKTAYLSKYDVFAKLYDTDSDSTGDTLVLSNDFNFTYSGEVENDYGGVTNTITKNSNVPWYSQRTSIKKVEILNEIHPKAVAYFFYGCTNLTEIVGLTNMKTTDATNMHSMFYNCSELETIDVSSFDTSNVTVMTSMFRGCSKLTTIYASSSFVTTGVTSSGTMFTGCTSIVGGAGTVYNSKKVTATYAHIDGGTANPGYFTEK